MTRQMPLPQHQIRTETEVLRRLARALCADEAAAADLVQDTWVAAIAQPPDLDRPVRPWLARVLFNRAISRRRATGRADARVQALTTISAAPAVPDAERSHAAQQLLDEVAALPELDRELLHARFWDGCTATECAQRFARPASTIRTQLARALAPLRRRLDARAGDREAWVAGLAPWLGVDSRPVLRGSLSALGLAIGAGAVVTALLVLAPNGCGAGMIDNVESTPSAAAVVAEHDGGHGVPLHASVRDRNTTPARVRTSVAPHRAPDEAPSHKRAHPKLSFHEAMQDLDGLLAQCRTSKQDAMLRIKPVVVFTDDDAPFVETVDFPYHENFSADELECVQESLLSMAIPSAEIDPSMSTPWRYTPTIELFFDDTGAMLRQAIARGPMLRLATQTEDGSDLRDAVAACQPDRAGTLDVLLTFEPITGRLAEVQADPSAARACVEQAVRDAVIKGIAFEPRAPEDASIRCTFALGPRPADHTCTRLGPGGDYVDAPG